MLDGHSYKSMIATQPSEDYIEIEPVTGATRKMKRSYTVTYSIVCADGSFDGCSSYGQLPFPSLDPFTKLEIPIFNVTEELYINDDKLVESVSYITKGHGRIWGWSAILTILAFASCTIACCFQSVFLMNTPVKK